MSGGKGGKQKGPNMQEMIAAQMQMNQQMRPKDVQLQTQGWGGMGYNMPQNPMQMGSQAAGQGLAPPAWATGDWAMPWWGQQAPNVGAAMLQQQIGQQGYDQMRGAAPMPQPVQQVSAQQAPMPQRKTLPRYSKGRQALANSQRLGDEYRAPYLGRDNLWLWDYGNNG